MKKDKMSKSITFITLLIGALIGITLAFIIIVVAIPGGKNKNNCNNRDDDQSNTSECEPKTKKSSKLKYDNKSGNNNGKK